MDEIYAHADFIMQMKLSKLIQIILIYNFDCLSHSNSSEAHTVVVRSSIRLPLPHFHWVPSTSIYGRGYCDHYCVPTCFLRHQLDQGQLYRTHKNTNTIPAVYNHSTNWYMNALNLILIGRFRKLPLNNISEFNSDQKDRQQLQGNWLRACLLSVRHLRRASNNI